VQLTPERLGAHLKARLAPVYLIAGEEPLVVGECADQVRAAARAQGFAEREVLFAEPRTGVDANALRAAGAALSLFATQRLLEVRLPTGKPGDAGAAALCDYAEDPAPDTILLVVSEAKPEAQNKRPKWFRALEDKGVLVIAWPLESHQFPDWLARRARAVGLELTPEAIARLALRTEGNLLAAAQELEKLALLAGGSRLDEAAIDAAVSDAARFDAFEMVAAALAGDPQRALRALDVLEAEGEAPALVSWALAREIGVCAQLATRAAAGEPLARLAVTPWGKPQPQLQEALARIPLKRWRRLVQQSLTVDRTVKGQRKGIDAWAELRALVAVLSGAFDPPRARRAAAR
jgi:DNA polymerase-3 subunit delta